MKLFLTILAAILVAAAIIGGTMNYQAKEREKEITLLASIASLDKSVEGWWELSVLSPTEKEVAAFEIGKIRAILMRDDFRKVSPKVKAAVSALDEKAKHMGEVLKR